MDKGDDSGMIEYGALANVNKDRSKAEALFSKAMQKNPREFWHWVGAAGRILASGRSETAGLCFDRRCSARECHGGSQTMFMTGLVFVERSAPGPRPGEWKTVRR